MCATYALEVLVAPVGTHNDECRGGDHGEERQGEKDIVNHGQSPGRSGDERLLQLDDAWKMGANVSHPRRGYITRRW